jgi:hypothetical protein
MTKYTYEIPVDPMTNEPSEKVIFRVEDSTYIPVDEANSDYQRYLNPDKMEHLTEIIPN